LDFLPPAASVSATAYAVSVELAKFCSFSDFNPIGPKQGWASKKKSLCWTIYYEPMEFFNLSICYFYCMYLSGPPSTLRFLGGGVFVSLDGRPIIIVLARIIDYAQFVWKNI